MKPAKTVLVTGFGPFGATPVNPAEAVASALHGEVIGGARVVGLKVPNSFGESADTVREALTREDPDLIVMLGEYGGRSLVTVERVAINYEDSARYRLSDNAGSVRDGTPVMDGAPPAYFTTLPIRAIVSRLRERGIPADVSDTPGTFVCNHLLFRTLHHLAQSSSRARAGWIHLPHLPEVAALTEHLGAPSMTLELSVEAVRTAVAATLEHPEDIEEVPVSRWQI